MICLEPARFTAEEWWVFMDVFSWRPLSMSSAAPSACRRPPCLQLGRQLFTHLKVYKGSSHPHEAQQPQPLPVHDKRIEMVY